MLIYWNCLWFYNSSSPFFLRFHYNCFRNSPTDMFLPSFFCRWFYELSFLNVFITCSLSWIILKFLKFFENPPRSLTIDKNSVLKISDFCFKKYLDLKSNSCFFLLKTCVFISSLILSKSAQRAMTWCGWKRMRREGRKCVTYATS